MRADHAINQAGLDIVLLQYPWSGWLSVNIAANIEQVLEADSSCEAPVFHWLTGWPREDLLPAPRAAPFEPHQV